MKTANVRPRMVFAITLLMIANSYDMHYGVVLKKSKLLESLQLLKNYLNFCV